MTDMTAFERQLSGEITGLMGPIRPVDDAAIFTAITATQVPKWRFRSMFSATKYVVAGAIVALFGGFLLAGVLTTQPSLEAVPAVGASASPEPSRTEAPIELPIEIPADVTSGRMDTPIGPARWVHLSGTADTLPDILEPVAVPGGYVSLDEGHEHSSCQSDGVCWAPATLWFSPDLLEWTPRPLPIESGHARLTATDGGYWLTVNGEVENEDGSFDPPTLWRSTDALDWEQVDLASVEPPPPPGIEWRDYLGDLAVHEDAAATTISYGAMNTGTFLGLAAPPDVEPSRWGVGLAALEDGAYSVLDGWGMELDQIRIAATDGGLEVSDAESGDPISLIDGVGMDLIERWAVGGGYLNDWALVLLEDGRVSQIELPEAMRGGYAVQLSATDDGFIATRGDEDSFRLWTSSDGREWTLEEFGGDDDGRPMGGSSGPDGFEAWGYDEASNRDLYWFSTDGIEWQASHPPPVDYKVRVGPGWIAVVPGGFAYVPDGSTEIVPIEATPVLKIESWGEGGHGTARISANTIRHSVFEDQPGEQRDHWIVTFEDLLTSGS